MQNGSAVTLNNGLTIRSGKEEEESIHQNRFFLYSIIDLVAKKCGSSGPKLKKRKR